jgi:hypothetical protein
MNHRNCCAHLRWSLAVSISLVLRAPAYGNGIDLASYTGSFTNLDQNAGSYMRWLVTFGDPAAPLGTEYAPIEFSFVVPEFTSYTWGAGGAVPAAANLFGTTEACVASPVAPECYGVVRSANHSYLPDEPQFGVFSQWYFVDVYYPGVQTFNFHFTDPPASLALLPSPFSLVSTNYLADGTPVGSPAEFSLTIDPDGTIHDVTATNFALSGPGDGQKEPVPEPTTFQLFAVGLTNLAMAVGRKKLSLWYRAQIHS